MAKNVEITFKIDGIDYSIDQLNELKKAAGEAGEEGKKSGKEAAEGQGFFSKKLDETKEKLKDFGASLKDLTKGFGKMRDGLTKVGQGFGLSGKAAQIFGKVTAGAVAATGIGLLVIAVVSLINYFKNLNSGAKLVSATMAALGAFVKQVGGAVAALLAGDFAGFRDNLKGVGDAMKDAGKAAMDLVDITQELLDFQGKAAVANADLKKDMEAYKKVLEDGTKSEKERLAALDEVTTRAKAIQANTQKEIELQIKLLQAKQKTLTNEQEINEVIKEQRELTAQLIDAQTEQMNITYDAEKVAREIRQQAAADRKAKADEQKKNAEDVNTKLAELRVASLKDEAQKLMETAELQKKAAIKELEAKGATRKQILEIEKLYDQLSLEQLDKYYADKKAKEDAEAAAERARLQSIEQQKIAVVRQLNNDARDNEFDASRAALDQQFADRQLELIKLGLYNSKKLELDKWYAKEKGKIDNAQAASQDALLDAQLARTAEVFGDIAVAAGEGTVAAKAAAFAQATINTYLGASQIIADEVIPAPLKPFAIAAIIAMGLKQVQAIGATQVPEVPKFALGGMIGGPSHAMGGVQLEAEGGEYIINKAAMGVPGVASIASSLNSIARPNDAPGRGIDTPMGASNGQTQMPLRAYVIATEMTRAQEINSNIERQARL